MKKYQTTFNKINDFKEGCKKKPKKKGLKEMFNIANDNSAQEAIQKGIEFLIHKYGPNHPTLFNKISFAFAVALRDIVDLTMPDEDEMKKVKLKYSILTKLFKAIKERI